jgi:hypothetical protein
VERREDEEWRLCGGMYAITAIGKSSPDDGDDSKVRIKAQTKSKEAVLPECELFLKLELL